MRIFYFMHKILFSAFLVTATSECNLRFSLNELNMCDDVSNFVMFSQVKFIKKCWNIELVMFVLPLMFHYLGQSDKLCLYYCFISLLWQINWLIDVVIPLCRFCLLEYICADLYNTIFAIGNHSLPFNCTYLASDCRVFGSLISFWSKRILNVRTHYVLYKSMIKGRFFSWRLFS